VIDKLREAEGAEYTRNLEAMCKDKAECASYVPPVAFIFACALHLHTCTKAGIFGP